MDLRDISIFVFIDADAFDEVAVAQTDFASRRESEEFFRRIFHEIGAIDPEFASEGQHTRAEGGIGGVEGALHPFDFIFGIVIDNDFKRFGDAHDTRRDIV